MNTQIQETVIIRDRGQLTVPESIRKSRDWMSPQSAVTIIAEKEDEVIIRPHTSSQKKVDWDELWRKINLARSYKGKYKGSLSKFIARDREARR
ncbi:hypothetical protein HYW55_00435 [Candidatus Gottesmanbacteria bacterium]|nr:hypothetical protein [Candidatus Gottesmanbacteria bacterium]